MIRTLHPAYFALVMATGIVSIAVILNDWCKEFGIERTPKAAELAKATA